jgi:hypothetical protein
VNGSVPANPTPLPRRAVLVPIGICVEYLVNRRFSLSEQPKAWPAKLGTHCWTVRPASSKHLPWPAAGQ